MEISTSHHFDAPPADVAAMMRNPEFHELVAARAGARDHSVRTNGAVTEVAMTLASPPAVSGLIGKTLSLVESITWNAVGDDGAYSNRVDVVVNGLPVTMFALGTLTATGTGTQVDYAGELNVRIPIVGKKVEREAQPYLVRALDAQAEVGHEWLAAR